MTLSQEDMKELQELLSDAYGRTFSTKETIEIGTRMVTLYVQLMKAGTRSQKPKKRTKAIRDMGT